MTLELISLEEAIKLGLGETSLVIESEAKRPLGVRRVISSSSTNDLVSSGMNETKESSEMLKGKNGNK